MHQHIEHKSKDREGGKKRRRKGESTEEICFGRWRERGKEGMRDDRGKEKEIERNFIV